MENDTVARDGTFKGAPILCSWRKISGRDDPPGVTWSVQETVVDTGFHKLRFDLIPPHAMTEVARAFTIGGAKHGEQAYLEAPKPVSHHVAALLRHLYRHLCGEMRDPDGQLHMASVAARALMILELTARGPAVD